MVNAILELSWAIFDVVYHPSLRLFVPAGRTIVLLRRAIDANYYYCIRLGPTVMEELPLYPSLFPSFRFQRLSRRTRGGMERGHALYNVTSRCEQSQKTDGASNFNLNRVGMRNELSAGFGSGFPSVCRFRIPLPPRAGPPAQSNNLAHVLSDLHAMTRAKGKEIVGFYSST